MRYFDLHKALLLLSLISVVFCNTSLAQETSNISTILNMKDGRSLVNLNGKVIDGVTGKGIFGANLAYWEASETITDSAGNFSLKLPDLGTSIFVSADGYKDREVAINGRDYITITLYRGGSSDIYEMGTIPFVSKSAANSPQAFQTFRTGGAWENVPETMDNYLQGKIPGLSVIRQSGTPNIGAVMSLWGKTSVLGSNEPLIVVDGVIFDIKEFGTSIVEGFANNPLAFLDLKDIEEISVLKNGSALYGTKGSNGVIFVKTTHAQQEATRIDAAIYGGVNLVPSNIPVLNSSDFRIYLSEILQSKGLTSSELSGLPYFNEKTGGPLTPYKYYNQTNWQDQILKSSGSKNGFLRITGGDNIAKYALSIGYLNGSGVIKSTDLKRYNARFNADLNLSKRLSASTDVSFVYNENNLSNLGLIPDKSPLIGSLIKAPFLMTNEIGENGEPSPSLSDVDTFNVSNPLAFIKNGYGFNRSYRFVGSASMKYEFSNYLSVMTNLAVTMTKYRESFFVPDKGVVDDTLPNAIIKNRSGAQVLRSLNFFNETRVNYSRIYNGIHHLDLGLGLHYYTNELESDFGLGFNSPTDDLTGVQYGVSQLRRIGGDKGQNSWTNAFFALDYSLKKKYLLSLNSSINGSSRLGKISKSGPAFNLGKRDYPLAATVDAGWIISSENLFRDWNWLSFLKVKGSVGVIPNDDIGDFSAQRYFISQNLLGMEGLIIGNIKNEALQSEFVRHASAGLDLSILNDRIYAGFDLFKRNTNHMVSPYIGDPETGLDTIFANSGAMETTGWDASVGFRIVDSKDFGWDLNFNVSHFKTKVTKYPNDFRVLNLNGGSILIEKGETLGAYYGYVADGVFASNAEAVSSGVVNVADNGAQVPFAGGDIHFKDLNGDGKIDQDDRTIIGDPNPDLFGGINMKLRWRRLVLNALFTYSYGNEVYNGTRRMLESMNDVYNQADAVQGRWKEDGQITDMPRAVWGDPSGNGRFSSRWIEDGSYFRLRSLSLSYEIPFKQGALKYLNVYLTGTNLFTITKYLGYDPEFFALSSTWGQGMDTALEPQFKTIQVGLRIGL